MNFKAFNIPVKISWTFWLFTLFTLFIGHSITRQLPPAYTVIWGAALFASILIHELGHALWYRWYGMVPKIEIHGMGGTTHGQGTKHLSMKEELVVTLAGPISNLILAGLAFILLPIVKPMNIVPLTFFISSSLYINLFLAVFNLIPVFPMDGGQALATLFKMKKGPAGATMAYNVSGYLAIALAIITFMSGSMTIIPILFAYFAFISFSQKKLAEQQQFYR